MKVVKKICLIGRFAVGKTSLVKQYIENQFNEKYKTTVGVSISTKELKFDEIDMSLVIWDIAGFEQENHYNNYLRGAQGLIWVIDGTEPESLNILKTIADSMPELKQVPSLCFINKHDLKSQWVIGDSERNQLEESFQLVFKTSAKTGENVEHGFEKLAKILLN